MSDPAKLCAHCGSTHPAAERVCPTTGLALQQGFRSKQRAAERARDVATPDPALEPGALVGGRYRLLRRLGCGGMSTVVEASIEEPGGRSEHVALKVLHRSLSGDQDAIARLLREADVVRMLAHPCVCAVLDMGRTESGQPYLVMELLRGESLAERLKRGVLSLGEVGEVLDPILDALEEAHARGILHRDLKPENVFLLEVGSGEPQRAKLLDFGVARAFGARREQHRLTDTGMVMGTPYYMAPEQARGEAKLDQRVDVWALGVMIYEALSGERPFHASNYNALLVKILTTQPRSLLEHAPDLPPLALHVVDKALAKRPEDRFQSVRELRRALAFACHEARSGFDDLDEPTVAMQRRRLPPNEPVAEEPTEAPYRRRHAPPEPRSVDDTEPLERGPSSDTDPDPEPTEVMRRAR
ncbi:MAG: serine/threonine protein kinase [Deltaproteobacteria bacterium]|nr:serine/threonine protein kinase [Deltaproteobacteria bacterium]